MFPPENLCSLHEVRALCGEFAAAAQAVYDAWEQDADGIDGDLGEGGICDRVAEGMMGVLDARLGERVAASAKCINTMQHTNITVAVAEGVFELDIPPGVYEIGGGGYTWRKRPGIIFEADDVTLFRLSADPSDYFSYTDEVEPARDLSCGP